MGKPVEAILPLAAAVLTVGEIDRAAPQALLQAYGLTLRFADPDAEIPGSFWGDSEAGLVGRELWCRRDTPLHSLLHEACHFICMTPDRREGLHTDAGGDFDEENAVCYLQILLADHIPDFGSKRAMSDMDRWGYSFRLGSAHRWFDADAEDARASLLAWGLIDAQGNPRLGRLRS